MKSLILILGILITNLTFASNACEKLESKNEELTAKIFDSNLDAEDVLTLNFAISGALEQRVHNESSEETKCFVKLSSLNNIEKTLVKLLK